MASILDNFTFAKIMQNFIMSAVAKSIPTMFGCVMAGSRVDFSSEFFAADGIIPIVMSANGRNTESNTDNVRQSGNTIYFPMSYNWMMCSITGAYWADTLSRIASVVGSNAALNITMNIIRVTRDGTESAIDSLQWTVSASEAPFKRLPVCINRGQGVPSGSGIKFKIGAALYPDKSDLNTSYSDGAIFTHYPTLTSVGSLRHFDVLIWTGSRINLINTDQEGG